MNQEVKKKWVEALRSGEYKQGTLSLRTKDNEYCCLGVLCEIAVTEGAIEPPRIEGGSYTYGEEERNGYLPHEVQKWAEIEGYNPRIKDRGLSSYNDSGTSFKEIADLIEENL